MFTKYYSKAIETFKKSNVIDYDQGLFLALSYLKAGDSKEAKKQFDKWISEDLEKSFDQHGYNIYLDFVLSNEENIYIRGMWDEYHEKYSGMEPYQLYCKLYKQHYLPYFTTESDEDDFDDEHFEIPPKLNRSNFKQLSDEYLYLSRKAMFDKMEDSEYERYDELSNLLFADVIF